MADMSVTRFEGTRCSRAFARLGAACAVALLVLAGLAPAACASGGVDATRVSGSSRLDTAAKAALAGFPDGSGSVIVASAENWPDALSASGLAGLLECPVVLTASAELSEQAASAIGELGATRAYVVGGEAAVSQKAFGQVGALEGVQARRVAGFDRFGTCRAIYDLGVELEEDGTAERGWSSTALVARGTGYADALAAAPYAYASGSPVMLAGSDGQLPSALLKAASSEAFDSAVVLGGTEGLGAITDESAESLGKTWCRIAGKDRMATSQYVAKWATGGYAKAKVKPSVELSYQGAGFARAWDFPDALASVGTLGPSGSVLMLLDETYGGETPVSVNGRLEGTGATKAVIFGGTGAVPAAYEEWLEMTPEEAAEVQGYITVGDNEYYLDQDGEYVRDQLVGDKEDGYRYAAADGTIMKGGIVGSESAGFYYADADGYIKGGGIVGDDTTGYWMTDDTGRIDTTVRKAFTQDGVDWIIMDGAAIRVESEHDKTLFRAFKELEVCTDPSMTKEQKLRAAYDHIKNDFDEYNPRIPHQHPAGWEVMYANDVFVGRGGNCISYGAALAFMAKAIGYDEVYAINTGHGWAEIDGLVYDPEWEAHHFTYSYFALSYDTVTDQNYSYVFNTGDDLMRVKI